MILIDSNIIISAVNGYDLSLIDKFETVDCTISLVTKIETLGYHKLTASERQWLEMFITNTPVLAIDEQVAEKAISLRQKRNIDLGDCLIAATALVHNLELWTNNVKDYSWIENLKWHNPMAKSVKKKKS